MYHGTNRLFSCVCGAEAKLYGKSQPEYVVVMPGTDTVVCCCASCLDLHIAMVTTEHGALSLERAALAELTLRERGWYVYEGCAGVTPRPTCGECRFFILNGGGCTPIVGTMG